MNTEIHWKAYFIVCAQAFSGEICLKDSVVGTLYLSALTFGQRKVCYKNGFKAYRPIMIQNGCLLMEVLSKRIKTVAEPQAVQMKR